MDIKSELTVAKTDAEKIAAEARRVEEDAVLANSWLRTNWHYALAIAVGFMILGVALGMKIGAHLAK